jgi:virulence-associated protein VapD
MTDPFTPDAFSLNTLTAAINNLPFKPGRLGQLGLFHEQGITTLNASIEERDGVLNLVDVKPRGADAQLFEGANRKIHSFRVPHLPARAGIMADEVQGVRAFGSESTAETLQTRIDERLMSMRSSIEMTIEAHRLQAIQGKFYDANGVLNDVYQVFGVTPVAINIDLTTQTTKIKKDAQDILESIEAALGGTPFTGVRVFCSSDFWKAFMSHDDVSKAYDRYLDGQFLRQDPRAAFDFGGIRWERYRGVGSVSIPAGTAFAVAEGVPELFITRFAPADYNETVNTNGLPIYSRGWPMEGNKGWTLEAQSNPLNLCTRPGAIVKLIAV